LFRKKTPDGQSWFPEINAVWIINESHYQQVSPDLDGIPALIMTNTVPDPADVTGFINSLQPKWADYHGVPLIRMEGGALDGFAFKRMSGRRPKNRETITRQEMWRRQYKRRQYLRGLSKQELSDYFVRLIAAQAPGHLKGATETQRALMEELMEPWTHLLEEVNFRGLDMREFSPVLKNLSTQIKQSVGGATPEGESRVLIKEDKQGPVTVEHHTRGATAKINFYSLSLAASRVIGGNGYLDHAASYAPSPINTVEEASEYALKEGRGKVAGR
jgi:hypothetical protein